MGKDYYAVLGIPRSSSSFDIQKAYRTLALKYHPDCNNRPGAVEKSKEIAEAYDVLSNGLMNYDNLLNSGETSSYDYGLLVIIGYWKAIYDKFGEEGLKRGIPDSNGDVSNGYTFHGDVDTVFRKFFGGDNPFANFTDLESNIDIDGHAMFGGIQGRAQPKQDPPIERDLQLKLEEVYNGCTKKMKISRKILNEDGQTTSTREKILTITVGRGWREGTKVRFTKEGDQGPNRIPCDIVFVIKDLPHSQYHREGNNLIYQPLISLVTALTGGAVELLTLDNRLITVPITDVIYPGREIKVVGEGMPLVDDPNERGDLIIRFNVSFPAVLNPQQKQLIKQALVVNI